MPTMIKTYCSYCKKEMLKSIKHINEAKKRGWLQVCSSQCKNKMKTTSKEVPCSFCSKITTKKANIINKSKSNLLFCSSSCAATYQNTHKIVGYRRSKLEIWLEQQLTSLYPNLTLQFNMKNTIQSELDIYIPSLKLAFELNGIFHYEPIFSSEKLEQIQNNDNRKFQACLEQGIELCIIDSSKQKRFTEQSSKQYLDIITNIINLKLITVI